MRIEIYIQARMGSTRLPGKVLKTVLGKPLLEYQLERVRHVQLAHDIIVLTTAAQRDDIIAEFCEKKKVLCVRGPEDDVLARYSQAANLRKPDAIVRLTADCPLIDPRIVEHAIDLYQKKFPQWDYLSNTIERTFPRGMDVEVFSTEALLRANQEARNPYEREHVTPYIHHHPELFRRRNFHRTQNLSAYRLTVDTPDDLFLATQVIEQLYPITPFFSLEDIMELLNHHPEWPQMDN